MTSSRCSLSALGLFFATMVIIISVRQFVDADTFWHLKVGELAFSQSSLLTSDPFSFTAEGSPWIYKDLLADVLLYSAIPLFGYYWLIILKLFAALSVGAAMYVFARTHSKEPWCWAFTTALLLWALSPRFLDRPVLFTIAIFPWFLVSFTEWLRRGFTLDRSALALLGLQWLWASLHREAIFGIVVLALGCLFALAKGRTNFLRSVLMVVGSVAVTVATPAGFSIFQSSVALFSHEQLKGWISEWKRPVLLEVLQESPGFLVLTLSCAFVFIMKIIRKTEKPSLLFALWILLLILYFNSVRWTVLTSIVAAFLLLKAVHLQRHRTAILASAMVASLCAVTHPFPFGVGPDLKRFPHEAMTFAEQMKLRRDVLNYYDFGGYVIGQWWPRFRVAIDGRADQVYSADYVVNVMESFLSEQAFAKISTQADWVLASNHPGKTTHAFLAHDPEWAMIFWSEPAIIYVKKVAYPELTSSSLKYLPRFLEPSATVAQLLQEVARESGGLTDLQQEMQRMVGFASNNIRLKLWLAATENQLGQTQASHQRLQQILREHAGDPLLRELLEKSSDAF